MKIDKRSFFNIQLSTESLIVMMDHNQTKAKKIQRLEQIKMNITVINEELKLDFSCTEDADQSRFKWRNIDNSKERMKTIYEFLKYVIQFLLFNNKINAIWICFFKFIIVK